MTDVYPRIETGNAAPAKAPRLLDVVREKVRAMHYSRRTEEAYVHWIRDYVRFHGKRHPREMGAAEVEAFLSHLAIARNVSASAHQQGFRHGCFFTSASWISTCPGPRSLSASRRC